MGISIHTPTKGATKYNLSVKLKNKISIHTPTKGATIKAMGGLVGIEYFNPHSHEGSDKFKPCLFYSKTNFNPHSHEGSDCK